MNTQHSQFFFSFFFLLSCQWSLNQKQRHSGDLQSCFLGSSFDAALSSSRAGSHHMPVLFILHWEGIILNVHSATNLLVLLYKSGCSQTPSVLWAHPNQEKAALYSCMEEMSHVHRNYLTQFMTVPVGPNWSRSSYMNTSWRANNHKFLWDIYFYHGNLTAEFLLGKTLLHSWAIQLEICHLAFHFLTISLINILKDTLFFLSSWGLTLTDNCVCRWCLFVWGLGWGEHNLFNYFSSL